MLFDRYLSSLKYLFILLILISFKVSAQQDTVKFLWPYGNMTTQPNIGGSFGEYRATSVPGHYHNGTDMSGAAGTPVLAVLPGTVVSAYDDGADGYNSYIRVQSVIGGKNKQITYLHTRPVLSTGQQVTVGQMISRVSIDHVHLIEYELGAPSISSPYQINSLRPDAGVSIFTDPWKPAIRYVKFLLDGTDTELSPQALGSRVDIIAHVEERNGPTSAAFNNGTYMIGYKILSADSQTVVYNPPDNGLRYKYYKIPNDAYLDVNFYGPESNTSKHVYIVTNGTGASAITSSRVVQNNYWNVDDFPYGNYVVMIFTEDTRGNTDTVYIPVTTTDIDLLAPESPQLKYVKKDSINYFKIEWEKPEADDLNGYRLFYSVNGTTFQQRDNESVLTSDITFRDYFYNQTNPLYLRLNALDNAPNVNISDPSDTYGIRMIDDGKKILIVDGFDRVGGSGSWNKPYHDFLIKYAEAFEYSFETCSNDEIINGNFNLQDYEVVIWMCGDESTADETFSTVEQVKVAQFLENGGKLFVSGSEIAWDLEGASGASASDTQFLRNYLKAKYVSDDANINAAYGIESTLFADIGFNFGLVSTGSVYNEDYPDIIDTTGGSIPIFSYSNNSIIPAGIAFTGSFNNSDKTGQLIYIGFPVETIGSKEARTKLLSAAFQYFGLKTTAISDDEKNIPLEFTLSQNFPNPFNPSTKIKYSVNSTGNVSLKVFDILGNEVAELVNEVKQPGKYEVEFDASSAAGGKGLSSGIYFYRLTSNTQSVTKKMLLLK